MAFDSTGKQKLIEHMRAIVGAEAVLGAETNLDAYAIDRRRYYHGKPIAVVKPGSTAEVAAVVRKCAETGTAIVPQGGNTGLVGGATPDESGNELILNLSRMNRIRALDIANNTLTAEAGCILAVLQQAARDNDRLFPLSLAAEGSCEIGGNLSTNAGGTGVLHYGNTRELALGLEVVLPSGEIWDGLRGLRKNNTGYDLKHLFIGAEGTLGVITAAVLKLFPMPTGRATAIVAIDSARTAVELLARVQAYCGERVTGFEFFSQFCVDLVTRHYPACQSPFTVRFPHYVLVELSDSRPDAEVQALLEETLGRAIEQDLVRDVAMAMSAGQSRQFWALRENISEAQAAEGRNIKHDVSVPISGIAEFIHAADAAVERVFPGVRLVTFGHIGDGNLHYNISPPTDMPGDAFLDRAAEVNAVVHDIVARFNGSISAEHGLGKLKREEITRYKSALELDMMRRVKAALDPAGIMNPGKVL